MGRVFGQHTHRPAPHNPGPITHVCNPWEAEGRGSGIQSNHWLIANLRLVWNVQDSAERVRGRKMEEGDRERKREGKRETEDGPRLKRRYRLCRIQSPAPTMGHSTSCSSLVGGPVSQCLTSADTCIHGHIPTLRLTYKHIIKNKPLRINKTDRLLLQGLRVQAEGCCRGLYPDRAYFHKCLEPRELMASGKQERC